jgi:hypothetical protein
VGVGAAVVVTGLVRARVRPLVVAALAAAVAVALALSGAGLPVGGRVVAVAGAAGAVAGLGARRLERQVAPAATAVSVLLGVLGVWLAVPDAEAPVLVLGAVACWAVAAWWVPTLAEPGGAVGWVALAAVVGWAAAVGGRGRPAAIAGALACWGVVVVVPTVAAAIRRVPPAAAVLGLQAVTVLAASRWAARVDDVAAGVVRSVLVLVVSAALTAVVASRWGRAPADRAA